VRNYQARNFMRDDMHVGDGVLFYHSSCPSPELPAWHKSRARHIRRTQFDPKITTSTRGQARCAEVCCMST